MEADLSTRFSEMNLTNQQEAASIAMFEKTKILDHIYIKYGLKLNQLEFAYA